tara:strand:- start:772 stop:1134 length:363 start_codon:yes stop_codon:yes gene_type:complete
VNKFSIKTLRKTLKWLNKLKHTQHLHSSRLKRLLHILLKPIFLRYKGKKRVRFTKTGLESRLANPQFIGFLEATRFKHANLDKYERRIRRKFIRKRLSMAAGILTFGWLVLESAQALSLF